MLSARTEAVSSVDVSAAQRFGWIDAATRPLVLIAPEPMIRAQQRVAARAMQVFPLLRAEVDAVRALSTEGRELARAAQWIDALPFKVDAQDGGLTVTLRLRRP